MAKSSVIEVKPEKKTKLRTGYAKQIFGLGVTSCAEFLNLVYKKIKIPENNVAYVSSLTTMWPKRATLVIVDGVKTLTRFAEMVNNKQVLVVSDVPVLIRTLRFIDAIDYDMQQSFCFMFKPVNIQAVRLALSRSGGEVEVRIRNTNQLGYVIDSLKKTDTLVSLLVAAMASIDFEGRGKIYDAFRALCNNDKFNSTKFLATVESIKSDFNKNEIKAFITQFKKSGKDYYLAIRSDLDTNEAAAEYDVDPYGISFFRKKLRAMDIATNRAKRAA